MTNAKRYSVVLVTVPDLKTARRLARMALKARLAACVNLLPRIESHYWWQGKLEHSAELLLILKTSQARLPALEKLILAEHPYGTPEFLALPIQQGSRRYLAWLGASVRPPHSRSVSRL